MTACFPGLRADPLSCQQHSAGICLSRCRAATSGRRTCGHAQLLGGRVLPVLGLFNLRLAQQRAGGRRQVDIDSGDLVLPRQAANALAWRFLWQVGRHVDGILFIGPHFGLVAGDDLDVSARFLRQRAASRKPFLDPAAARIIGRRRKPKISELIMKLAKKFCRRRDRLQRIERVSQSHFDRGLRHELRNALRARRADLLGAKPAFLPQQAHKESDRDIVFLSGGP